MKKKRVVIQQDTAKEFDDSHGKYEKDYVLNNPSSRHDLCISQHVLFFAAKKRAELVTLLTHPKKAEQRLNKLEFFGALALYFIEKGMSFDEWDLNARWNDYYYSGKDKFKELQKFVKKCKECK